MTTNEPPIKEPPVVARSRPAEAQQQIDRQAATISRLQAELSGRPKRQDNHVTYWSRWFIIAGLLLAFGLSPLTTPQVVAGCFAFAGGLTALVLGYLSLVCQRLDKLR